MSTPKNQNQPSGLKCCVDYCQTNFEAAGQQFTNNYKCNQRHFGPVDFWYIQKNIRKATAALTKKYF